MGYTDIASFLGNDGFLSSNLSSSAKNGIGGEVTLSASGNVTVDDISSFGGEGSGNLTATSRQGNITTGIIFSKTTNGSGGVVDVGTTGGDISINHIATHSDNGTGGGSSGNIGITSTQGDITTQNLESIANTGNVLSIAGGSTGNIDITSTNGGISTENITSAAQTGTGGNITLNARSDINTGDVSSTGAAGSGDISLTSRQGNIRTGTLHTDTGTIRLSSPSLNAAKASLSITLTDSDKTVADLEENRQSEFEKYFGKNLPSNPVTAATIQNTLVDIQQKTGNRSAVIYVNLEDSQSSNVKGQNHSQTEPLSGQVKRN